VDISAERSVVLVLAGERVRRRGSTGESRVPRASGVGGGSQGESGGVWTVLEPPRVAFLYRWAVKP
jgi:hypothetical protein